METKDIIQRIVNLQKEHFQMLTYAVGSPVCVFDGAGHEKFYGDNKRPYNLSKLLENGNLVNDRVRFNSHEIIIEADKEDWELNYTNGNKIKDYLEVNNIPFMLIITGGKGMRFHIFIENSRYITQKQIFFLYVYLCQCIGLKWQEHGVPENKQTNHILGCIGKIGKYGFYATYSNIIPLKRPQTRLEDIKFPEKIQTWEVPDNVFNFAIDYGRSIPEVSIKQTLTKWRYKGRMLLILKW